VGSAVYGRHHPVHKLCRSVQQLAVPNGDAGAGHGGGCSGVQDAAHGPSPVQAVDGVPGRFLSSVVAAPIVWWRARVREYKCKMDMNFDQACQTLGCQESRRKTKP
jgi:hypothetical protein